MHPEEGPFYHLLVYIVNQSWGLFTLLANQIFLPFQMSVYHKYPKTIIETQADIAITNRTVSSTSTKIIMKLLSTLLICSSSILSVYSLEEGGDFSEIRKVLKSVGDPEHLLQKGISNNNSHLSTLKSSYSINYKEPIVEFEADPTTIVNQQIPSPPPPPPLFSTQPLPYQRAIPNTKFPNQPPSPSVKQEPYDDDDHHLSEITKRRGAIHGSSSEEEEEDDDDQGNVSDW